MTVSLLRPSSHHLPLKGTVVKNIISCRVVFFSPSPNSCSLAAYVLTAWTFSPSLVDSVSIVDDLSAPTTAAANPLAGVEEGVALIAGLELDVDAELVLVGRGGVGDGWIGELFEDFLRAGAPADGLDGNVGGRFVLGLKEIVGIYAGCEVFEDELGVLAARLKCVSDWRSEGLVRTYDDDSLAPSTCPLSTDEADPVAVAEHAWSDSYSWVELDAHAEVELESGWGELEGSGNIVLVEAMEEVVGWDGFFHDILVGGTFKEMLSLS